MIQTIMKAENMTEISPLQKICKTSYLPAMLLQNYIQVNQLTILASAQLWP